MQYETQLSFCTMWCKSLVDDFALGGAKVKLRSCHQSEYHMGVQTQSPTRLKGESNMENLSILLCCGAGMSSGFLAQRARQAAKKKKMNVNVEARSHSDIASYMSSIDILMVGPHYAGELPEFEKLAGPHNVPVCVIPQDVYAQLQGDKLLDLALSKIEEHKNK